MNRIKSTLARLGIRNFKPTLRKAAERLATVHTPEGMPLPPNTVAELQRDMARLGFVVSQIRQIEEARQKRFLMFQKESALALWYRARTADSRIGTRKTMIPAFARNRAGTQTGHRALALCHHW